ncbi:DUF2490 domain-containing protein [Emticicia sp.]|uniref:DUF2490 domain-containing protein n=1 Tax=Emticicia sp. TaxID=1930953 RepID=UPI0037526FAE
MKKTLLFLLFNLVVFTVISQNSRIVQDEEQFWTGYFNQTRLSDKWGIWLDVNLRTTEHFVKKPSKAIGRLGLMYYLNDDLKFTNAYAFINHFPEEGHANISQPEHRIWHQLQWHTKYGKIRTMQWVRLEERFRQKIKNDNELAEGYRFDERIRYNFLLNIPLNKKGIVPKSFSAILNNEVMINLSKNNIYNIFDQNRFFVGLAYNFNAHSNLQFGYMNVYQQLAAGNKYKNINAIRVFFFQNLDFRTRKDK